MSAPQPDPEQIASFRREHIGRYFLRAHRAFSERAFEKFQDYHHPGLRFTHMALIAQMDIEGSGTSITVLAERAGITKQAMSQIVDELESRGYVRRTPSPQDRRATLVQFTDTGFRLLQDAYRIKQEIEAEYIAILGEEGFQQLRSLLSTLLVHVE